MKMCPRCNLSKPLSSFYVRKLDKPGKWKTGDIYSYCKECVKLRNKKWHADNPEKAKAKDHRAGCKRFGLTTVQYNDMLQVQQHLCKLCGKPETATRNGKVKFLAIDHNHSTGEVRGLLCGDCNMGLGKFRDNTLVLLKAARYIEGLVS
jgi:hypothetical protein